MISYRVINLELHNDAESSHFRDTEAFLIFVSSDQLHVVSKKKTLFLVQIKENVISIIFIHACLILIFFPCRDRAEKNIYTVYRIKFAVPRDFFVQLGLIPIIWILPLIRFARKTSSATNGKTPDTICTIWTLSINIHAKYKTCHDFFLI